MRSPVKASEYRNDEPPADFRSRATCINWCPKNCRWLPIKMRLSGPGKSEIESQSELHPSGVFGGREGTEGRWVTRIADPALCPFLCPYSLKSHRNPSHD